jgi:hypothetical protein
MDFTVGVNKELVEVPVDIFDLGLLFEVHKDWVSCWPIDLDLLKDWELDAIVFPHFGFDNVDLLRFLFELVAGESNDFESLLTVLLLELDQLFVVLVRVAAFGCNIENDSTFGSLEILVQSRLRSFSFQGPGDLDFQWFGSILALETRKIIRRILLRDLFLGRLGS